MPLALKHDETTGESADLIAFKERVKDVAGRYAKQHGWCDVVNTALKEIGVEPVEEIIRVQIDFSLAGSPVQSLTKRIKKDDLINLSPEEQAAWVSQRISPKVSVGGSVDVTIPVAIIDLNEVGVPDMSWAKGGWTYPDGVHHFKNRDERRRKVHLMSHADAASHTQRHLSDNGLLPRSDREARFPQAYYDLGPAGLAAWQEALGQRAYVSSLCRKEIEYPRTADGIADAPADTVKDEPKRGALGLRKKEQTEEPLTLCPDCVRLAERYTRQAQEDQAGPTLA